MMKKSSIFMIVYVVFLAFSIYISDDEHLTKIALGTTFASMFFACSDMFFNSAQYLGTLLDRIMKSHLEVKYNLFKCNDMEKLEVKCDDWMQNLQDKESFLHKSYIKVKRMRAIGNIIFAIGIFVFLSVITFYNADLKLFEELLKNERKITILAFAIVVANYTAQDLIFVKQRKDIIEVYESIEEE